MRDVDQEPSPSRTADRSSELSVREQVTEFKTVSIHLVPTQQQLADVLTKALPAPAHTQAVQQLLGPLPAELRDGAAK